MAGYNYILYAHYWEYEYIEKQYHGIWDMRAYTHTPITPKPLRTTRLIASH